jgi:ribonuclease Z
MLLLEAVKCKRDRRLFLESNNGADHKMNTTKSKHSASWENDEVSVDIPFSVAGVGTTVAITSKFTGKILLMDVGDEIDLVAITHGHFDHMGGLWSLLGFLRDMGRTEPLNILVPTGCDEVSNLVSGFRDCYSATLPFQIYLHKLQHGSGFDTDFFKLNAMGVEHYGLENQTGRDVLMPAFGYSVRIGETTVAFTGDSRMCISLQQLVDGADLAVIEATHKEDPESETRMHLTEAEAKELGELAKNCILFQNQQRVSDCFLQAYNKTS